MAKITTGQSFNAGDQITSTKLNNIIGTAFLDSDSVTGTTLNLTSGQLKVATNGITSNELNANSVITAKIANNAVTYAKIQDVAASSVIGNTTGSTATPSNVAILDEDNMASNSATSLATQQSIKAYVDSNGGNEVSILTGTISTGGTIPLPNGYTQSQCKWMVAVGTISSSHGDHNSSHNVTFTANSSRVVTTTGIGTGSGTANYIIIGVK